jgi:hypothetical protein
MARTKKEVMKTDEILTPVSSDTDIEEKETDKTDTNNMSNTSDISNDSKKK